MPASAPPHFIPDAWGRALLRGAVSWWHMIHFAAVVLVMALSPSTYNRANRATTSQHIYASTWQVLPWFTALAALLSLVLIRIVVVTAYNYGLSQYALQMVVRVLVLELIPLSAALFVALRAGLTFNAAIAGLPLPAQAGPLPRLSMERLRRELVPKVFASAFSVLTLAMISSVIALVLAYLIVHGFSLWGLPGYTRTVGHVFDLTVTLGFLLKTFFFSLAVAVVPVAANLEAEQQPATDYTVQPGAVRLFLVLLLIEAASLAVKYI
ncbi:MlaE family ABC transporter permease [Rhodoferax ferrireducens]|uniref:MlaE family ABC transporter permease n=1 Tax=Rhodoferax ferrireducens TaxID=192843 RepID=UPI000E0D08B6|nr:ABC transporter permease [Rhodoferax ferrireducens]